LDAEKKENAMKRFIMLIIILLALVPGSSLYACTGFCISKGDTVLFGNNEDHIDPDSKVFYVPAEKGKYGGVYFGFDNPPFPQGGMNEKGLVFDMFAIDPNKVKNSLDKPKVPLDQLIDKVMSECATVDEALEIFDKYNLAFMEKFMLFIADANGDSAIIERDTVLRKKGKYQVVSNFVVSNFYQSKTRKEDFNCGRDINCGRYLIATAMLEDADDISVDLAKRVLAATHNEAPYYPTVYSYICDLKRRIVYLYHFHNFQNEVVIDLKAELAKGARTIDLPDLFPKTYVAENFKKTSEELEMRKAKYTHNVAAEVLNSYVGQYQLNAPEGSRTIFKISTSGGKLFSEVEGRGKNELLAASNNDFAIILGERIINVTFVRDSKEEVEKMRIVDGGQVSYANRVK
jgi:hypothetical protein